MAAGQLQALLQQQAQFLQQTVQQLTNAHTQAMTAMAEMVRTLQIDVRAAAESIFLAKDKESMTTKRAFTIAAPLFGKSSGIRDLALSVDPVLVAGALLRGSFSSGSRMTCILRTSTTSQSRKRTLSTRML